MKIERIPPAYAAPVQGAKPLPQTEAAVVKGRDWLGNDEKAKAARTLRHQIKTISRRKLLPGAA